MTHPLATRIGAVFYAAADDSPSQYDGRSPTSSGRPATMSPWFSCSFSDDDVTSVYVKCPSSPRWQMPTLVWPGGVLLPGGVVCPGGVGLSLFCPGAVSFPLPPFLAFPALLLAARTLVPVSTVAAAPMIPPSIRRRDSSAGRRCVMRSN